RRSRMRRSTSCTTATGSRPRGRRARPGAAAWRPTGWRRSASAGTGRPSVPSGARRAAWRAAQAAVTLLVVGLAARSLIRNWDALRAQPVVWDPHPLLLALSALVVWTAYAGLIGAWRVMLASWGQRLDRWTAARIWTVSGLGKYL